MVESIGWELVNSVWGAAGYVERADCYASPPRSRESLAAALLGAGWMKRIVSWAEMDGRMDCGLPSADRCISDMSGIQTLTGY